MEVEIVTFVVKGSMTNVKNLHLAFMKLVLRPANYVCLLATPFLLASASFGSFGSSLFNLLNSFVWLRITDEDSVPKYACGQYCKFNPI